MLRSAAGFHIVKLLDKRSHNEPTVVDQTHARHILVRVNELTSEADAKAKIERLKDRIDIGRPSSRSWRKLNSEDALGAKGGDLGWLNPGDTVAEFERGDEEARDEPGFGAGAHRLSDGTSSRCSSGASRTSPATASATEAQARDPPAQGGRGVSGLGAPDPRPRLRRSSPRRSIVFLAASRSSTPLHLSALRRRLLGRADGAKHAEQQQVVDNFQDAADQERPAESRDLQQVARRQRADRRRQAARQPR